MEEEEMREEKKGRQKGEYIKLNEKNEKYYELKPNSRKTI